jgi:hypothetical protein
MPDLVCAGRTVCADWTVCASTGDEASKVAITSSAFPFLTPLLPASCVVGRPAALSPACRGLSVLGVKRSRP